MDAHHSFMELALDQGRIALKNLEVPIGCVIVEDGIAIASGSNRTTETRNATRHAEMEAIDVLLEKWQKVGLNQPEIAEKFSRCDVYVTCEPCIMCASALSFLGIRHVYYGCANDKFGGCGSILSLHETTTPQELCSTEKTLAKGFKCTGGIMKDKAVSLLQIFYEQGNPNAPRPHRRAFRGSSAPTRVRFDEQPRLNSEEMKLFEHDQGPGGSTGSTVGHDSFQFRSDQNIEYNFEPV